MEQHRLDKMQKLKELSEQPFVNYHKVEHDIAEVTAKYAETEKENLPAQDVWFDVAGRIMALRPFGKAAFITIKDRTDIIQVYVKKGEISDEQYAVFDLTDVGDIVGIKGFLFKTKTGELTICAKEFRLLTKALRDLPEKWHGLKDIETRYRQRYVDLIVNEDVKETFKKRSLIVNEVRKFFLNRDFFEVETPMMHPIVGGATAKPFITHHNALDMPLYLRIAPELYLKRLVVGGFERIFEINRNFRNEGLSTRHNPEFTMIEWYNAYNDYHGLMDMIQEMCQGIAEKLYGKKEITFNGNVIDLSGNWPRLTMQEAIVKGSNITDDMLKDRASAEAAAAKIGVKVQKEWGKGKIIMEIFEELIEHTLINPTFIIDYPKEVSPLAKSKKDDPETTERFELFMGGFELANGFNELNDPIDQYERFAKQVAAKEAGDEEACMMDTDYIRALEYGLPPTAGAGLGIDRLVMLFTDSQSIRDVVLFPHMRPEDAE
ncbi:lysine--tRNA ligase [Seleniivibrio woodruffii]|uniref:Lysine--tRNA ligase n=1 Tax=Seleniivibrio woodruffii TaxID=1078050 RepID=A0A4R1K9U3_9BACT|nr:lysine--tRNA ligase [Seleniivibrio woodruffii]TCK60653.1 lysyl-tRNA synthetase class II [Seleniivibrio woodruffii]TVZ36283.1 lysyl-tRNA synthetase class II [Seleniivibrio woodruffii]